MKQKPKTDHFRIANVVAQYKSLKESTLGILSASTDGTVVNLSIANSCEVQGLMVDTHYCVESHDKRTGIRDRKLDTFGVTEELPAGKAITYSKEIGKDNAALRITGTVYNKTNSTIMFWFNAHTEGDGWSVSLYNFIDNGATAPVVESPVPVA